MAFAQDHDSLQAQAHIWNHIFNFINSMSLKCAVELRIPDAIHEHGGQPVTLTQLVSALGIQPGKTAFVRRLMRLLTHSGFFIMQNAGNGEDTYLLSNHSHYLFRDHPHSISPFLLLELDPLVLTPWQSLSAWFRGDSPTAFHHVNGAGFWEFAGQTPKFNDMFNEAMASDSHLTMDAIIKEHRDVFHGLKSLVDVGGGNGAAAMALAEAFPQLKCTVLELPHVVASSPNRTAMDFIAGDMFEYVPPADAVFLKWILHDWSDEHCVNLLKLCKEAIPPKEEGGKVIIVDMVVNHDLRANNLTETQYLWDMQMMVFCQGGKERDEEEWRKLFTDAGFNGYKIVTPALGLRAIIELYP